MGYLGKRARSLSKVCQVKAGLGIRRILIVNGEQPVPLRADVADLQKNVAGQFALNRQIVLRGILRAEFGGKLSEEQNRTIQRPIYRLVPRRIQERVRNIGKSCTLLSHKRRAKERVRHAGTHAERRLRAELLENQLFDGIVEEAPSHADGGFVRAARKLREGSIFPAGTPIQAEPRRECFVIGTCKAARNAFVSRYNEPRRSGSGIRASRRRIGSRLEERDTRAREARREIAWEDRRVLSGVEPLNFLTNVG